MPRKDICPHCGANLRDKPLRSVKSSFTDRVHTWGGTNEDGSEITEDGVLCWRDGEPMYGSRVIGIEIFGIYDGILFWQCPECDGAWHRWEKQDWPRLYNAAEPYVRGEKKVRA